MDNMKYSPEELQEYLKKYNELNKPKRMTKLKVVDNPISAIVPNNQPKKEKIKLNPTMPKVETPMKTTTKEKKPKRKLNLTEEQRQVRRERMRKMIESGKMKPYSKKK